MKKKELGRLVDEIFDREKLPVPRKTLIEFLGRVYEAGYGDADVHERSAKVGAMIAYLVALRDLDVWAYHSQYGKKPKGLCIMVGFRDEDEVMISFDLAKLFADLFGNWDAYEIDDHEKVVGLLQGIVADGQKAINRRKMNEAEDQARRENKKTIAAAERMTEVLQGALEAVEGKKG